MDDSIFKTMKKMEYGIYVVSMGRGQDGNAFTASWLTQVSANPPMVSVSINNRHQSARQIVEAGYFVVNFLGKDQHDTITNFSGPSYQQYRKLVGIPVKEAPVSRAPIIPQATAYLDCKVVNAVNAGDHTLIIGQVIAAEEYSEESVMTTLDSNLKYTGMA